MNIEAPHVSFNVGDSENHSYGFLVPCAHGYAANMRFHASTPVYLAKWKDSPEICVIMVPSKRWLDDLRDEGFTIIAKLSTLVDAELERQAKQEAPPFSLNKPIDTTSDGASLSSP